MSHGLIMESVFTLIVVVLLLLLTNFLNFPYYPYKFILHSFTSLLFGLWIVRIILYKSDY
jgi:hypothetical protein